MNNEAVSQSLINIEENLKNLDSARNQVDNVVGKSQELAIEVSNLIREIQVLKNEFDSESNTFKSDILKIIKGFETDLKVQTETLLERSSTITIEYSKNTDKNIKNLIDFQDNIETAEKKLSQLDFQSDFIKLKHELDNVNESNHQFKLKVFGHIEDLYLKIEAHKVEIIKDQENRSTKLNDSFTAQIKKYADDQNSNNKELSKLITTQNNRLKFNQKILFAILITAVLGVFTTYLLFK